MQIFGIISLAVGLARPI